MTKFKIENSGYFLFVTVAVYLIIACNSTGYHHWDEHFQIIEFANFKAGKVQPTELAWEYNARVRPALQPFLCFMLFKMMFVAGITNPYIMAFLLRLISAIFSIWVINRFIEVQRPLINKGVFPFFVLLSYFLWFLPYINVRFSSENWSGLFFLMSLTVIFKWLDQLTLRRLLLLGIALGVSILFRFQSALMVGGVLIWLIVIAKVSYRRMLAIFGSILLVLLLGILIDSWFYGTPSFTLYNYFDANIIKNIASSFGTAPWYQYLVYIIISPGIFGILIMISLVIMIIKDPKHICLWAVFPFLLVHSIIPHKELRFLFPLANMVPLFLVLGYQYLTKALRQPNAFVFYLGISFLFLYNLCGLMVVGWKGAGLAKVDMTAYIYKHYSKAKINVMYIEGANPYQDITPQNTFYRNDSVSLIPLRDVLELDVLAKKKQKIKTLLVIPGRNINEPVYRKRLERGMAFKHQTFQPVIQQINDLYDTTLNGANLVLYEFE